MRASNDELILTPDRSAHDLGPKTKKRQTVNEKDIMQAIEEIGFDKFNESLEACLHDFKEKKRRKREQKKDEQAKRRRLNGSEQGMAGPDENKRAGPTGSKAQEGAQGQRDSR